MPRTADGVTRAVAGKLETMGLGGTQTGDSGPGRATVVLDASGQWRGDEGRIVEHGLLGRPGVIDAEANPVTQTITVTYDPSLTSPVVLRGHIVECGYRCAGESVPRHAGAAPPSEAGHERAHPSHEGMDAATMARDLRDRFIVAAVLAVPIMLWSPMGTALLGRELPAPAGLTSEAFQLLLSLPVVFYSSMVFFRGAVHALRRRTLDMMVLVAVAIAAGWGYSVAVTLFIDGEVFYEAAAFLAAFVLLGHWLEMRARGGANDAVRTLLELAPPMAVVERGTGTVEVPTDEVGVGDTLLIRPGARVPVDAAVLDGESHVDESMVTGESMPVVKRAGDALVGGTINGNGSLRARASAVGADTALARIVKLVQEAQGSKPPSQRLADRAAFWLVLVALVGGAVTFVVWAGPAGAGVSTALLFAITVVVITCPDALGLATPMAITVGSGLGARHGILFKNAVALESTAGLDTVVLDKTGTLTEGRPAVVSAASLGPFGRDEVLGLAAAVESRSEHPLAQAVVAAAAADQIPVGVADRFTAVPGRGAVGYVDGRRVTVGNARLLRDEGVRLGPFAARADGLAAAGRTVVYVAVDGRPAALLAVADRVRPTAKEAVAALRGAGLRTVMLTGDSDATARRIAAEVGVDEVLAEVLPDGKAAEVARLQGQGRKVAMVGDGVNDAPALARADVGIAIGAGTDVAMETADVVLMRSDPADVLRAVAIGRATVRKMRQNLGWAVGYNALALPVAAGVFAPLGLTLRPEIAAVAMSGSSILVAMNALLLKRLDLTAATGEEPVATAAGATSAGRPRRPVARDRDDEDAARPAA